MKVDALIEMNLMHPSGLALVGLAQLFEMNRIAFKNGENFPKSIKKSFWDGYIVLNNRKQD